ncbi:MAG TPA: ABC transporter permease, partial [Longimicrobiales bacterium]|nr:ABC transporter permease [Longimicrobiales bacterium]
MRTIWRNVRHSLRSLLKKPGFTGITVVTLAVGIGANTAIFSVVDGVLLEALPYPEPERLVSISHSAPGLDLPWLPSATGIHLIDREENRTFRELALFQTSAANLTGDGAPERIRVGRATPSLFRVLQVDAARGRTFTEEEGLPGEEKITVVSHRLWTDHFGSDPQIVGKTVRVDGEAHEIVGVMPEGFAFPTREVRLWTPIRIDPAQTFFGGFNHPAIGRLEEGVEVEDARRDLARLLPRIPERFQGISQEMLDNAGVAVNVRPYLDVVVGDVGTALWILLGTVSFVLLIACANVANLLLVRAESRQREVAIRTAMGADRGRLFGQFVAESGLLAGAGAILGLLLAHQGIRALLAFGPANLPRIEQIDVDGTVLAFTAGITVVAALVFGLIPVLRSRGPGTAAVLRDGYRGSTDGRSGHRARKLLVVSQVAFALILLVGSGLMIRSFQRLQGVDPGFSSESVLTFRVALPRADYPDVESTASFHQRFLDRLEGLP